MKAPSAFTTMKLKLFTALPLIALTIISSGCANIRLNDKPDRT
jgi:hypothetical protein